MPKLIIHSPAGTFDVSARQQIASALMTLGLDCEALPQSSLVRSTVWTYFAEYASDAVFMGDTPAWLPVVSLQIYVIKGGLDVTAKKTLIKGATEILDRRQTGTSVAPVYVVINETEEENWGIFGQQADLAALRASSIDAPAI
ncbi:MAG TPA: tautomerase family protein [Buttiauxella sp.]|nr:tautomerase family protein [Buttiauxella sp.]